MRAVDGSGGEALALTRRKGFEYAVCEVESMMKLTVQQNGKYANRDTWSVLSGAKPDRSRPGTQCRLRALRCRGRRGEDVAGEMSSA
jgi:hypothetical protein